MPREREAPINITRLAEKNVIIKYMGLWNRYASIRRYIPDIKISRENTKIIRYLINTHIPLAI